MKKIFLATLCCITLLTSFVSAINDPSDYGPEAETDFESKRDAWASGYNAAIEYSSDSLNDGNAYNEGYDEGYAQALKDSEGSSYDEGYSQGYEEGYRAGYGASDTAPDNDIIDRSEIHSSENTDISDPVNGRIETKEKETKKQTFPGETENIALYVIGAVGIVALVIFIVAMITGK